MITIRTTTEPTIAAEFLAGKILKQLEFGKAVLWFATGGSSIPVAVEASKIISKYPHKNLAVTLTDERYGPVGHADSNWQQLFDKGFDLKEAKLIPVLTGESREKTTEDFNRALNEDLKNADYKIGLFGIGPDGHTAGILPDFENVNNGDWTYSYATPKFERITLTPKAILKLNEAVAFMQGEQRWWVIKDLEEKDIDVVKQPAQILKKLPLLTIFTDYKK